MDKILAGKRFLIQVADTYEDLELWYPKLRMEEAGATVVVAGIDPMRRDYKGKNGYPCKADAALKDMKAGDFDALVIPGGFAPDIIRRDRQALDLTRAFYEAGKPVAFICHAGWVPISAKIVKGHKVTGCIALKDDLENAGAIWVDASVVVDENLISSRRPADLPDFCAAIIDWMVKKTG
jgi:protease I